MFKTHEGPAPTTLRENSTQEQTEPTMTHQKDEVEAIHALSSCISEMSLRYEAIGNKFQQKLDNLEQTQKSLNHKFELMHSSAKNLH